MNYGRAKMACWMVGNIRPKCFLRAHGLECTLLSISMNPCMRLFCRLGLLSLFIVCSATALEPLAPDTEQRASIREILHKLDKRHYRHLSLDDTFSSELLDLYLKRLDPTRTYVLASDIAEFEGWRNRLDDDLRAGDLDLGFRIFNKFRERLIARLEANVALLESGAKFDFDADESLPIDTDTRAWFKDAAEADDYWRRRLKDGMLRLIMSGKDAKAARELLVKRYKSQLHRASQQQSHDAFELYANAVAGMYDPHTSYMDPRSLENFQISMSLSLEGIGAVLQAEDEYTKIVRVVPGGPADKQGRLRAGDRITGVAQGVDGEMVDVIGWRLDDVVDLIRGKKDSQVRLDILPATSGPAGSSYSVTIIRDQVKLEEQAARGDVITVPSGSEKLRLGIITLPTFYMDFEAYRNRDENFRSTTRDVYNILQTFRTENIDGIILDLRNNGGGSLYEATALTDLFIDPGPVVQIRHANGKVSLDQMAEHPAAYRGPLVVLINRLSASASEIFAGAIQDYGRGLIVGTQTFGKGTVQVMTPLKQGQLKLTESKFYRVSGDSTQERGVLPDIVLPSLYDVKEIGDGSQDRVLRWDRIKPADHDTYKNVDGLVAPLVQRHEARVVTDADWRYLLETLKFAEQNRSIKELPLKRAERERLDHEREVALFDLANAQRKAKGEPPHADLAAWRKEQDALSGEPEDEGDAALPAKPKIDLAHDPLLKETGNILGDYVGLLTKRREKLAGNLTGS
jgi:carboxyl-terminal processing protease